VTYIDTHCHIGHIKADPDDVMAAADAAGVQIVVDIGMGTAESAAALARTSRFPGRVYAAVGVHPNDLGEFTSDPVATMGRLRELAADPAVVGIGETGLDFYRDRETPEAQEAAFRAHIELAKAFDRALVIHCRDAHRDVLRVLDEAGPPARVIMHCFSGDAAHARECAGRGFFCSFAGNVTYPRNTELREAVAVLPSELLLVETDAPFLAPMPHRGKPNAPAFVPLTAAAVAAARAEAPQDLAPTLLDNARRAFRLP
jgi:TatD DNase family protein